MKFYPLFLKLKDRAVLLVGAGAVATQKIKALLESEARIRVVAPEATPAIKVLAAAHRIHWQRRGYKTTDLRDVCLVIAATDDPVLQARISRECRHRQILVNCVNDKALCDFYTAAIVNRGTVQIAISTGGTSPALAKRMRQTLEKMLDAEV